VSIGRRAWSQRGSAVVDAAAADREQKRIGSGVGHRRDAGGLGDRGAAQTFAGKPDMVISGINTAQISGKMSITRVPVGAAARRRAASHSFRRQCRCARKKTEVKFEIGARDAGAARIDLKKDCRSSFAQRECAGAVERRREITRQSQRSRATSSGRKRSARAQLFLAVRAENRQGREPDRIMRRFLPEPSPSLRHLDPTQQQNRSIISRTGRADRSRVWRLAIWSAELAPLSFRKLSYFRNFLPREESSHSQPIHRDRKKSGGKPPHSKASWFGADAR